LTCIISVSPFFFCTEIIQVNEEKVNKQRLIKSSENIIASDICAIVRIANEIEINDQLESIEVISKYMLHQKRKKIKKKKSKKPCG
jgi:ribosomal protein L14E/L6E/L27E